MSIDVLRGKKILFLKVYFFYLCNDLDRLEKFLLCMASVSVGAIQLTSYVRWIVVCRLALSGGAQAGHRRKLGVLHLATVSMRTVFVLSRIKRKRKKKKNKFKWIFPDVDSRQSAKRVLSRVYGGVDACP